MVTIIIIKPILVARVEFLAIVKYPLGVDIRSPFFPVWVYDVIPIVEDILYPTMKMVSTNAGGLCLCILFVLN